MNAKLLIAVSAERITLVHWRAGKVLREFSVQADDEQGVSLCRGALTGLRHCPVYILVDAVEEDYRTEILPHARGTDRRELVARKLKQHYRSTPYSTAEWQGRETVGRRDDRYQFAALTNPDLVAPWIALIEELGLPLAGVYLAPMAGLALVRKLALRAPHVLLVARMSGGLRLTYFRGGQFRLSRLAPCDAANSERREQFYVDEVANTRLYLHALQAASLDEPLAIVLLDPRGADADAHRAIASESASLECVHVTSRDVAGVLKRKAIASALETDVLFLHLLALETPKHNLAPAASLASHRRLERRLALYRACAAVGALAVLGPAYALWKAYDIDADTAVVALERQRRETEYATVTRSFPEAPASAAALEQAVAVARRLTSEARTPERALAVVSRALSHTADIALNEIRWSHGVAASAATPASVPPPAPEETIVVSGEVRPFSGDYRSAMAAIRALAEALAGDPAVREARIARLPLNIDPAVALSGNTRDTSDSSGTAEFTLQVTLRPRT